jgi:NADH dehydrogenase
MSIHIVTGAFGYSGKYIAARLLKKGVTVRTVTNSVHRQNPFGDKVAAQPFHFDDHSKMTAALAEADVLYNTYWVRFNHDDFTHATAVENTLKLFAAAKEAGVRRVIHISITNPTEDSELEYFSGKARLERLLMESGLSYSILRPTVLFGKEDILLNNIAWALRRLPIFGVFGTGDYRLQPIYVDDLADLAVREGQLGENRIIDAIGPETFTFRELVRTVGESIGKQRPIISVSPGVGYLVASLIGKIVGDVFITREEIDGLMQDLLCTDSEPTGTTKLSDWVRHHADELGVRYASELARRRNRTESYEVIDREAGANQPDGS